MKTTDIKTLSPEQLAAKVSQLENQMSESMQDRETKVKLKLWDIFERGAMIYVDGDTEEFYSYTIEHIERAQRDLSLAMECFVWAQMEKQNNSSVGAEPLPATIFRDGFERLVRLNEMFRSMYETIWEIRMERKAEEKPTN